MEEKKLIEKLTYGDDGKVNMLAVWDGRLSEIDSVIQSLMHNLSFFENTNYSYFK